MVHKLVLSTFALLTLATCQNQKMANNSESSPTEVSTITSNTNSTPVKTNEKVPEMSDGLPPDNVAKEIAEKESAQSGIIYLKEGEKKVLPQNKMNITFKRITQDSRCPKDVNCIWAGVATAEIELLGASKKPLNILLSTMDDPNKGFHREVNFDGYTYSLVEISPELTEKKGFKANQGKYKIGVKMVKGDSGNQVLQRN